jgi:aspartate aminotransferase-like enzyme
MIGGGVGGLMGRVVRIGHMGTSASYSRVSLTLTAMEAILRDLRGAASATAR